MNQRELAHLHREAEAELKKYPGVVGVGYGYKERGGKVTEEIAFRVYVEEKKSPGALKRSEIVPSVHRGIPTDVLVRRKSVPLAGVCDDHDEHSPLIGGIAISTFKNGSLAIGTLGFFAFISGKSGNNNVALVTNNHVVTGNGEKVGDTIYQPSWQQQGGVWRPEPETNSIADILKLPDKTNYPYQYPNEPASVYYLDCASGQLNICVSPTCHTNCGVKFANSLRGFNLNGSDRIAGVARLANVNVGDTVYKSGAVTGITVGKVIDPFAVATGFNVIEIDATQANCHGNTVFAEHGDSGSAIINSQSQLVGILFGHDPVTNRAHACHIHPAMDALGTIPITSVDAPTDNPAFSLSAAASAVSPDATAGRAAILRKRLEETEEGRRVATLVEEHHLEVVHLVNHRRRALVTWHRKKGPSFLNEAAANIGKPEHRIPREIEGITRGELLQGMASVLAEHGSAKLRRDIERNLGDVLKYADAADSVAGLLDLLVVASKTKEPEQHRGEETGTRNW